MSFTPGQQFDNIEAALLSALGREMREAESTQIERKRNSSPAGATYLFRKGRIKTRVTVECTWVLDDAAQSDH